MATAGESAYGATKAAVLQLSQCLRADWAGQGVGVTAICPGFINTPIAGSARFTGGKEDPDRRAQAGQGLLPGPPAGEGGRRHRQGHRHQPGRGAGGVRSRCSAWYAHRLTPIAFQQSVARLSGRSLNGLRLHLPRSRRSLLALGAAATLVGGAVGLQEGRRARLSDLGPGTSPAEDTSLGAVARSTSAGAR